MIGSIACQVRECFRNSMVDMVAGGGSTYYLQYVFSQFLGLLCPHQSWVIGFWLRGSSITHSSVARHMSGNLAKPCQRLFLCCSTFCHDVELSKAAILLRAPALWSNVCPSETAARKFEVAGEYGAGILKSNMTALLSCLKDRTLDVGLCGGKCGLAEYQVLFHSLPSGKYHKCQKCMIVSYEFHPWPSSPVRTNWHVLYPSALGFGTLRRK